MLRTNLATRPFYNVRAVQAVLAALTVLAVLLTLFNVVQLVRLTSVERQLGARADEAEAEAAVLRAEAQRTRSAIDADELATVAAAAAEANAVIDRRTFSWTELFTRLEASLPPDVRLTRFQPRFDQQGRFLLGARVEARRVGDLEALLDALDATGVFQNVLASEEQLGEDGLIDAVVEGQYVPPPPGSGAGAAEAREVALE